MATQTKYLYYIAKNISCSDRIEGIKEFGTRIFAIPVCGIDFNLDDSEGPFSSISTLKKESSFFQQLARTNSKSAQKILEKKNIHFIKDFIFVPEEQSYTKDFIKLIDHTIKGHFKAKNVFGIHFYDKDNMRIREFVGLENSVGVWQAMIDVYDKENNKWIEKRQLTTFFPKNWSRTQLFHECEYAYHHRIKQNDSNSRFISKTTSGIKVVIIINNGVVKSIYPVFDL